MNATDELLVRRQARRQAGRRDRITQLLSGLYEGHTEDRDDEGELKGIVVVRLFESGPVINSAGVTLDDYRTAATSISRFRHQRWLDSLGPAKLPQGEGGR